MADDRSGRRAPPAVSSPDSPCLTDFSVAPAIGCQLAEAPGRCRPRAGSARCVSFVARAAAAALCVTVLAFAVTPAKAQTVTIEKISGEESFDSAERATSKFRIRARGSDAPWQGANEHAGITVGVKFDYEGRDLEYWSNSNYTRAPGKKVSSFEVVLARSWQAVGSVPGNRFWDLTEHDMGNHDLHLIGPVIVRLYDPPGGRTYSLGSDTAICLVINESGGTAGEPCSSSQRRSVQVRERLTASFDGLPDSHDGQTAFSFRIQFSEDIDATVDGMRDHALNVSGGTVTGAARVNKRDDLWSFTITPSGDGKVEITLAGGASCTADGAICTSDGRQLSTGLLTIVSGPMPTLSVADVQAYEGVDDHMTFYVSMDRAATERSWVKYATADGTAEAGSDYTAKSGELHFFPGEKVRWKIQVPIIDDTVEDDGEAFTLTLSDPKGVTIGDGVATGTIRNSEEPVEVSVADAEATEGEDRWMRFRLSLNHIAKDVSVDYATADGTATAGVDYVASSGSVVLRKGTIHTYITVPILSDSVEDDGERFTLTLSNVSGAAVADGEAVGTIRDGEPEPGSTVSTVSTVSTGPLWSADMSVVDFGNGSIGAWGADKFSNVGGTEDLGAKWLWYHTGDRKLHLAFTTAIEDTTGLSLYIGDAAVAFPVGGKDSSFSWTDVDIAWADGETVPVRIAQGGSVVTPPANAAPTGLPAISETARVREILTASVDDVADADGLENAVYAYQWIANNGTADADIAGATGATYTPVDGDAGKTLKVRVTFTDDKGTEETLTSVATAAVAATVPSAPVGLAVATGEGRERELTVSWTAPESNGGSEVTGYRVQWKSGTEAWDGSETSTRQAALGDPAAASHTIAELANGTAYTVRVVATNAAGDGEAAEVTATAQDRLAPVLTAASVNGTALTLTFSEALDAVSKAAADAFAISVEGTARTVDAVALSGSAATLTLASGVASGETVTMGYTVPTGDDATPLQDAAGNAVAAYSGHAVTNETPAAANTDPTGLPAITGTPQVSDTLTASISDIDDGDGLDNAIFAYQWLANDGTDDTEIADATGATHEVAPAQVGKTLKVRVTFTDDASTEETLTSAATEAVAARAPDAPGGLTVAAAVERASELNVSWTAPASDGGAEVTGYKVQWKSGAESYDGSDTSTRQALVSDPAVLTHTITGLTVGTAYTVRVLAVNTAGDGAPAEAAATTENRVAATISSVAISSDTGDGNSIGDDDGVYGIDDAIQITVTFDQAVIVTGAPELELDIGSKAAPATYASSAGNEVVFSYTVAEGDADTDGIAIGANKLALDGGSIKDASDNDANLAHASLAAQSGHLVDGVRPTIAQAGLHGSNGGVDNVYVLGELVGAYLQFTEAVTVNGSPELTLDFESGPKAIPLSVLISCGSPPSVSALTLTLTRCEKSQHQGTSLIFSHTVVRGDEDTDGPGVGANALTLNGATIADLAGNAAVLTHAAVAENTDYIIDGIPPAITSVEIVSDPGDDDTYGVGDVIRILIKFDDRVYVYWHAPRLRLDVGGKTRMAYRTRTTWEDISEGEDGKVLAFTYTVAAGDNDDNGIAIGANALQLGWGELKEADSLSRNDADITHAAVSDDAGHKVSTPAGNTATDDDAAPKSGLLTITGTVKVGNTVSADTSNLTDEDGLAYATYTYSWFVEGGRGSYETTNPGFTIAAAHEGKRLQASVLFFDDNGNREERSSAYTQPVKPRGWSNSAPTGAPAITGTPQVGETLTASISDIEDADGLDNATFAYQWLAHDGTDDSEIAGATGSTHEVAPAEVGKTLKVRVTFTDDVGTEETLTSVATEAVAARAPDAPGGLTVAAAAGRAGELDVSWTAPASDGGSEVTGYKVQWKSGAESYDGSDTSTRQALVSDPAVLTHTITGLTVGTAYTVRVLAVNAAGDGAAVEVEATVQDRVHPTLSAASVNGTALTLTFSEALDAASKPGADAFAVTVAGDARTVDAVALSGSAVTLVLASAVASGETVTVGYTPPTGADASPLKDAAGNAVVGFTGEAVTNDTAAPVNAAPTGLPEISGTPQVGEVLTASVAGIADADDVDAETFAYQWLANNGTDDTEVAGATSETYTVAPADAGKVLKVRVTFTDGGGTEEVLTSAATESVPVPLTAQFRGVPESHDGSSEFSFEVLFSEPVRVSYVVLKQQSFEVTGGTVEKAKRARDGNGVVRHDLREIHIQPNTQGDVTVVLAGGRACGTEGAICTADEKVLSGTLRLTVPGPASTAQPAVSVAGGASPVTEGAAAAFTLTRTGDVSAALMVAVEVTETGAMLAGEAPIEVTFAAESATAALTLATVDDEAAEAASVLAVTVASGDGYTVASEGASAEVTVADDDAAPEVTTALALAVAENATAVATLEATDTDTESLAWSIAGGADAGAFVLSEAGALAFNASKDFEAPDDSDGDGTYEVTVRVTDGANPVDVALTVGLTDVDEIAPALAAASVNATALTLTFSETLDAASKPAADAFAVTVAGDARTVDAVSLSGSAVELTLASAVASGETVTVGYTAPTGANAAPLKDAAGNPVAGFTGEAVTNGTPAPENTAPTGLPEISGTPQVRETLTASESAVEDGLDNAIFAWQWLSNDGTQDTEIAAATAATYTPVPGDVGKTLKVRVTFSDDAGNAETLTSAATAAVLANVPEAPRDPAAATADGREQELTVSWTAPASDGGAAITGYRVQWKSGSEDYDATASSTRQAVVTGLTHTIAGLTDGVSYTVRIVAVNDAGDGAAAKVSAEPRDRVVPVLSKAAVDGVTLTLTYGEALDEDSAPGAEAFAVTVADATRTVDAVAVSGSAAVLTLASAAASGETVTVDYTPPTGATANPLQDAAGNAAAAFTGEAVTNGTAAPANTAPTGLPAISGTAQVGEVLTASANAIEDADGLENATFVWQWLSNDGSEDVEIEAATAATYQPVPGDIGKTLMVRVTFSDDAENEEMLVSAATEAVIAAPVKVSIAAASSPVTEGSDAVFTLTRTGDTAAALTVGVSVSAAGAFLDGAAPTEASFAQGASTATLRVATTDDGTAEADGRVSASVSSGTGYAIADGAGGAGVDVLDNDKAAPALTVLWSATMTVADYGTGAIGAGSADLLTDQGGSAGLSGKSLWYYAPARKLRLGFTEAIPEGDGLTLHLGSRALALPEGSAGNSSTAWEGIDVAWSDGETIAVRLTAEAAVQVPAGPGISVADARVQEAAGAELSFRVTLDAAQSSAVSVRYATSDGTAVAGADYVAARGAVRFAPGQMSKTVRVLVLEDAHDDSGETLALTLSSPFGAQLSDGQATGTIINTDPVPQAWLARFGRTVAGHVVDAISGRFEASAGGGSHVTLGGQRLSLDGDASSGPGGAAGETSEDDPAARDGLAALAKRIGSGADRGAWTSWEESGSGDGWMRERGEDGTRSMTGSELLLGSSFHLSLGNDEEGARAADTRWTAWGRASSSRFDGDADGLSVDGEVTTFTLGADAAWARWLAGVAVSLSEGEGGFRDHPGADDESRGTGALESTLTSVHPYARLAVNERLSVWGILGYGTGELTLEVEDKESWTTDTAMEMAAAGARGVLVPAGEAGGFELSVRTDAQLVRMTSEAARGSDGGNLAATQSDTSRLRVMLEGSRAFALEGGGALTPSLEAGLRHDAGDAETGTGIEIGGGLSYTDPATGITVEGKARGLVAHEDTDYSEWGASGSVRIDPGAAGRGLALSLSPAWGADSGGAERLWSARDARALAANDAFEPGGRLEAEAGYGLGAFGGRGLMTPFAGLSLSDAGNRTWRSGVRWTLGPDMAFGVEGALREAANDDAAEHEIGFRLKARF